MMHQPGWGEGAAETWPEGRSEVQVSCGLHFCALPVGASEDGAERREPGIQGTLAAALEPADRERNSVGVTCTEHRERAQRESQPTL